MPDQTVDLGISREYLEKYLTHSGLWSTPERRQRNRYVLSPSAYAVSAAQRDNLETLGRATYKAVERLQETIAAHAAAAKKTNEHRKLLKLGRRAARGLLDPETDRADIIPPVLKVDLVQHASGCYSIAEVDAYNPRGLGYLALLEESLPTECRTKRFPGIALLCEMLLQKGDPGTAWTILLSEYERFYEPAFDILARSCVERGVQASIVRERDVAGERGRFVNGPRFHLLLIPETLDHHPDVRVSLMELYRKGVLQTFYPPTAYLGSKAYLPFLRTQEGMSTFLPKTSLVSSKDDPAEVLRAGPSVLKGTVSSGMKKVIFSDLEPERFEKTLAEARATKTPSWILQEQVLTHAVPVVVFDEGGKRITRDYFLRVVAHITKDGVLDVEVTGRPDRMVHGAPDCIQLPVIFA